MKRTQPNNTTGRAAGFTLLEVILAVTITAIVSAALFTSLSGAFTTRRQIEDHLSGRESARAILSLVRTDLQCVPPPGGRIGGVFIGERATGMNNAARDQLTYVTANTNLKSDQDLADRRQVELRLLESAEDDEHYVLARMVTGNLLATATPEPALQVLSRRVVSLHLRYLDAGEWVNEWDSTQRDNALPAAVEIVLVTAPEQNRPPDDEDDVENTYITTAQIVRLPSAQPSDNTETDFGFTDR